MHKRTRMIILATLLLTLGACGGGAGDPQSGSSAPAAGDPAHGADLYAATCTGCHGPDAKGLPNLGKDLTTSAFLAGLSDADAVAFLKVGRPGTDPANTTGVDMPPKGGNPALSDADLADIVAYLRTLAG